MTNIEGSAQPKSGYFEAPPEDYDQLLAKTLALLIDQIGKVKPGQCPTISLPGLDEETVLILTKDPYLLETVTRIFNKVGGFNIVTSEEDNTEEFKPEVNMHFNGIDSILLGQMEEYTGKSAKEIVTLAVNLLYQMANTEIATGLRAMPAVRYEVPDYFKYRIIVEFAENQNSALGPKAGAAEKNSTGTRVVSLNFNDEGESRDRAILPQIHYQRPLEELIPYVLQAIQFAYNTETNGFKKPKLGFALARLKKNGCVDYEYYFLDKFKKPRSPRFR